MALLKDADQEHNGKLLSLELNLLGLEAYANQTTEGWHKYSLTLYRKEDVITQIAGTLHDNDLRSIESMFGNIKKDDFEPLEPDFQLTIEPLEAGEYGEYTLTCMVNHGASIDGVYGASAVGIRLVVTQATGEKFANVLKSQRIALTKNMEFRDYEAKPLPEN